MNHTQKTTLQKAFRIAIALLFIAAGGFQLFVPQQGAKADVSAGFSEYFVPGAADDIFSIMADLTSFTGNTFTNVITIPITTPNLTVYYDHWENGYATAPDGSGAAGDEVYTGYPVGSVLTFKSTAIPNPRGTNLNACTGSTNPNGSTTACYDGKDRIFVVGGAVSIAQVYWPTSTGTVYANSWEVYPVKAWEPNYTIPVGEDLYAANPTAYADFNCVYVMVQAKEDNTSVTFDNTRTAAPGSSACGYTMWQDGSTTLAKGGTYYRGGVYSGSTISADKQVQVQLFVGRKNSNYDSRSHTLVPSGQWDKVYYSPVPSYGTPPANVQTNESSQPAYVRLRKSALETGFYAVGDVVHYSYVVSNTSSYFSPVSYTGPVTISDNKVPTNWSCPALSTVGNGDNKLDRGESITCTGSYTITAADLATGSVTNKATATLVGSGVNSNWSQLVVSAPTTITTPVNIYMYNPTDSPLAVTYEDLAGSGVCTIPAYGTMSVRDAACMGRFVAVGSAVKLSAAADFFALGEYDSGSSARNWGFSMIPYSSLGSEYFLPWAPGDYNVPPTNNGSPVFVTPTYDGQEFFVDFSPRDGVVDLTFTLDMLEVRKILDPDKDNTGMRVWSDGPFAMTWGQDAQYSATGNPYIDAGYTILPPNPNFIDIVIDVDKSANPELISRLVGEEVEFTVDVSSHELPLNDIFIEDYLPPYFEYVPGTTLITWPVGNSYTTDPVITGNAASGYTLHWGAAPDNIGDLAPFQMMTLKFKAVTVSGFETLPGNTSVNNVTATGYWAGLTLSATAQATVSVGDPGKITIIKDAVQNSPQAFPFKLVNILRPQDVTNFSLVDDGSSVGNSKSFGLRPGNYTVKEDPIPATWTLKYIVCEDPSENTTWDVTTATAYIDLAAGEEVICTFINYDHPTGVTFSEEPSASAEDGFVRLSWQADPLAIQRGLSLSISRSESADGAGKVLLASGLTDGPYDDSTVERGKTYYYWVEYVDAGRSDTLGPFDATLSWFLRLPIVRR